MKPVAGGDAEAGEGEAPAAAKAAAALCCAACAGEEARVRSPGVERRMLAAERRGRGRLFRRPANLARAGEGAVQAHRSSSAEAWALVGR